MRVVCWECPDCGHQAHVVWKDTPIACDDCAAPMDRMGTVGVVQSVADDTVPVDELQDVVDKWQKFGPPNHADPIRQRQLCADELQQTIDNYSDE